MELALVHDMKSGAYLTNLSRNECLSEKIGFYQFPLTSPTVAAYPGLQGYCGVTQSTSLLK